jgi:hypothetical protein
LSARNNTSVSARNLVGRDTKTSLRCTPISIDFSPSFAASSALEKPS